MKTKLLFTFGITIFSISQITSHYLIIEDSIKGIIMGFGIGLLIIALFQIKKTSKV